MNSLQEKKKSFWERPEGTTGMIFMAAGAAGLYFALPFLLVLVSGVLSLLGYTIGVVVLVAVLAALLAILTDKRFLTLMKYIFKSSMRAVTGVFTQIDPIGIMKSYISDLKEKRLEMAAGRDKLSGQITVLKRKIDGNDTGYKKAMSAASTAKQMGDTGLMNVNARQAGRLQKVNEESFIPLLNQMEMHLRAIKKFYDVTGVVILDLENEVEVRKTEREMIMASYSAMSAAKKIIQGGTDERELFDEAMEHVISDFGMKMGEIDMFLDSSRDFVAGLDMQNGVYEADALKKLQEWEARGDSIVVMETRKDTPALQHSPASTLFGHVDQRQAVPASNGLFDDLLKR